MKNILKLFLGLSVVIYLGGCTKGYLDVNDDPNYPTVPELSQLLSGSQFYMVQALSQGNFIGTGLSSYVHHLNAREVQNYSMMPNANNPTNTWNQLYSNVLINYDLIIQMAEEEDNLIYAGIAKTLKAYTFSVMVDLWGDIPYSEYNVFGNHAPKSDKSADIYNELIALLEDGLADLKNTTAANGTTPGGDDFFYEGDADLWAKLNNTVKLRLLLHSRKAKSDITDWQGKLNALITADAFIEEDEDFQFWFNDVTSPRVERHPAYSSYAGQHTHYISPYFYETMNGDVYNTTDNPFAGITDPRIPYYFYKPINADNRPSNPIEYRNGNFLSIFFATLGPNAGQDNRHTLTKYGVYPIGGKFDDGNGGRVETAAGTAGRGIAPHKMITYASLQFMLAELALVGEINVDDDDLLESAIYASIEHVHSVAAKNGVTVKISDDDSEEFVDAILARYAAANADGKLRILMTQKWIHNFLNPVDVYTDHRRTGYPLWFDPQKTEVPGYGVNPDPSSDKVIPLSTFTTFPRSLYYPTSDTDLNRNMTQKTDITVPLVFWDK